MYHPKGLSSKTSSFKTRVAREFLRSLSRIKQQKPILQKSSENTYLRGEKIKMAAYSSMARAVGSRRAWSRALLFKVRARQRAGVVVRKRCFGGEKKRVTKKKAGSGDQLNQAAKLRRIVPGGEAMEFGDLLEETAHYIKCLATQVTLMKSIADHLYSP